MIIIETPISTKQITSALSEDEYRLFQLSLAERPDAGKVIPGSGGLRKLRWSAEGRGKRGGLRVIYYWFIQGRILLLFVYPKNVQGNLTDTQLKQLKKIVEEKLFQELLESVKQGAEITKGTMSPSRTFQFPETEVRLLRERFGLSQNKFATLVGISVGTLRNWEQGRRKPEGPARVLLTLVSEHPEWLLNQVKKRKELPTRPPRKQG
jgi:DNA-binding transcriptional regulator YiaG